MKLTPNEIKEYAKRYGDADINEKFDVFTDIYNDIISKYNLTKKEVYDILNYKGDVILAVLSKQENQIQKVDNTARNKLCKSNYKIFMEI